MIFFQENIPHPPATDEADDANIEFTKVECLLLAFHTCASQAPEYLADNPELMKDFKVSVHFSDIKVPTYFLEIAGLPGTHLKYSSRSLWKSWKIYGLDLQLHYCKTFLKRAASQLTPRH